MGVAKLHEEGGRSSRQLHARRLHRSRATGQDGRTLLRPEPRALVILASARSMRSRPSRSQSHPGRVTSPEATILLETVESAAAMPSRSAALLALRSISSVLFSLSLYLVYLHDMVLTIQHLHEHTEVPWPALMTVEVV